jgi:hypothetical protein
MKRFRANRQAGAHQGKRSKTSSNWPSGCIIDAVQEAKTEILD